MKKIILSLKIWYILKYHVKIIKLRNLGETPMLTFPTWMKPTEILQSAIRERMIMEGLL